MSRSKPFVLLIFLFLSCYSYSQNKHCSVVRYVSDIEMFESKAVKTDTVVFQVNDRQGEDYTHVSIPYSKSNKISGLKAWIEDAKGNRIRNISSKEITDRSAISDFSLFEDDYVKEFQLKYNYYPYRIVYTYTSTIRDYLSLNFDPIVNAKVSTDFAQLTLKVPSSLKVKFYSQKMNNVTDSFIDDKHVSVWKTSCEALVEGEELSAHYSTLIPELRIVPSRFLCGVEGSNETWQSFGNWQWRLCQNLSDLPVEEKEHVIQLVENVTSTKEKVKILYHYLQDHTRYVNVTLGIGGLKPYPASYVSVNKYGDCKALTNYMEVLLETVGIKSYYSLVYSGMYIPEYKEDEVYSRFNHVVLMVPVENDTIWLENTDQTNPFGYMGVSTQNHQALLIDENNSHFVRIPALSPQDVLTSHHYQVKIEESGFADLSTRFIYKGYSFQSFTNLVNSLNAENQDFIIHHYLTYPNADLNNWALVKNHRDSTSIMLKSIQTIRKAWKALGTDRYFGIYATQMPEFEKPAKRTTPVVINYPISSLDTINYSFPLSYKLKAVPENIDLKTDYGYYTVSFYKSDSSIQAVRSFCLYAKSYSLEEYPAFYKFIASVNEADKSTIILQLK